MYNNTTPLWRVVVHQWTTNTKEQVIGVLSLAGLTLAITLLVSILAV